MGIMSKRAPAAWTGLLAFALAASCAAQDVPTIGPTVEFVESGGYWTSAGGDGSYRLIVETVPRQHLVSTLFVQWITTDSAGGFTVIRTQKIELGGLWRLLKPEVAMFSGDWVARLEGVDPSYNPMRQCKWTLALGLPGKVSLGPARCDH